VFASRAYLGHALVKRRNLGVCALAGLVYGHDTGLDVSADELVR
jgi:hypothetical protein